MPSQQQDGCRLAGVIRELPIPGTTCVGGTKCCLHRGAQESCIDATSLFKISQKLSRGADNCGGDGRGGTHRERHSSVNDERFGHGRSLSESGKGPAAGRPPETAAAQTPPRRLSLFISAENSGAGVRAGSQAAH